MADDRSRDASTPLAIPARGWREVLVRVYREMSDDNLSHVAAGVAFYAFLALFPAIAAMVLGYGLIADSGAVEAHLQVAKEVMPAEGFAIVAEQARTVAGSTNNQLSLGLLLTILLAVWSATKGVRALMTALNMAYHERESRGFLALNVWAMAFTIAGAIVALIAMVVIGAIPAAIALLNLPEPLANGLLWLRWPAMAIFAIYALAFLYSYGPSRATAKIIWVTPGAMLATIVWIAASLAFSVYVTRFGTYNAMFGSLGAVVVLMMWLYLSAYSVCLGAVLNAELELQTRLDSTTGPALPLGRRGAYVADQVAE
ncbi:MAG: YihY/virulence factor BrkB family protein [Defluviicoccus sp.]